MRTIHKFELLITDNIQTLELPDCCRLLHLGEQEEKLFMWVELDTDDDTEPMNFLIFGTGHDLGNHLDDYIGTVQMSNGLVWHIYQLL